MEVTLKKNTRGKILGVNLFVHNSLHVGNSKFFLGVGKFYY